MIDDIRSYVDVKQVLSKIKPVGSDGEDYFISIKDLEKAISTSDKIKIKFENSRITGLTVHMCP